MFEGIKDSTRVRVFSETNKVSVFPFNDRRQQEKHRKTFSRSVGTSLNKRDCIFNSYEV